MRLDVVDINERDIERESQRLGRGQPHQQRSDETRPAGDGDGGEFVEAHAGDRSASSIAGMIRRTWAREAISGTTPP